MKAALRLVIVGLVATLVACGGAEDRKTVYMKKGQEYYEQGNYEKARLEFQNVLQIDPKDLEARFHLAESLEKLENWQGAASHYLAVMGEKPDHRGALLNMGRLFLLSNNNDKARENAEKILSTAPDDVEALTLMAAVEAKAGDRAKAMETIERALKKDPQNAEGASLKASLLLLDGKSEESIKLLNDAIAAHPDEVALSINLARVYASIGRPDDAATAFAQVIEKKPDVLAYRSAYARFLIGLKRNDEAEKVLKDAIAKFPEEQAAKLAYIEFLSGTRSVKVAIDELSKMIAAEPDNTALKFALGKVYEATNQLDEAGKLYDGIIAAEKEGPDLLQAKGRMAVVKARQKDLPAAKALVEEVLKENPRDADALTLRGTLLLNEGDAAAAIADFRTILRDAPANVAAVRLLSRAHIVNKEPELAKDVLKQGIEANEKAGVLGLDLANFLASQNELDEALATLDTVLAKNPKELQALEGKFKIFVYRKELDKAAEIAEQMKTASPEAVKGYHFAGLVQQAKGNLEASIGEFQSALDRAPDAVEPLSQLIKSHLALKQRDLAVKKLKEVIARSEERR